MRHRRHVELIDRLIAADPEADPHEIYRVFRDEAPVFYHQRMGVWIVARHEDVRRALRDGDRFAPLTGGPGTPVYGRTILQMSGKEHSRKTAIVARRMRNPRILDAQIRRTVDRIAAQLLADIARHGGPLDLKACYTCPLPMKVITAMLAVPEGEQWLHWYEALAAGGVSSISGDLQARERALRARKEIFSYIGPVIDQRRRNPGRDLLSDIASMEYQGESLTDHEARAFVAFLLTAGVETTDRVLSSLLGYLARHADLWRELRDNRERIMPTCAEALRLFPPVQALTRQALEAVEIAGQPIEAGEKLLILLASANRDETVFERAQEFLVDRFHESAQREFTGSSRILAFGGGIHHCTGAQLARVEMERGLGHLLDQFQGLRPVETLDPPRGFVLRSPPSVKVHLDAA